jgi:hypothetical protein
VPTNVSGEGVAGAPVELRGSAVPAQRTGSPCHINDLAVLALKSQPLYSWSRTGSSAAASAFLRRGRPPLPVGHGFRHVGLFSLEGDPPTLTADTPE